MAADNRLPMRHRLRRTAYSAAVDRDGAAVDDKQSEVTIDDSDPRRRIVGRQNNRIEENGFTLGDREDGTASPSNKQEQFDGTILAAEPDRPTEAMSAI